MKSCLWGEGLRRFRVCGATGSPVLDYSTIGMFSWVIRSCGVCLEHCSIPRCNTPPICNNQNVPGHFHMSPWGEAKSPLAENHWTLSRDVSWSGLARERTVANHPASQWLKKARIYFLLVLTDPCGVTEGFNFTVTQRLRLMEPPTLPMSWVP